MTARARRQPERDGGHSRKRRASEPGLVQRSLLALGALAARHPSVVGGCAAFGVVFSFIAANALWYQPGHHPSPILKTRSAQNTLGFAALRKPPGDVTTFRIEREGEGEAAESSRSDLVHDLQVELARQGYYAGDPDGLLGEATAEAIRRFQQEHGLAVSGAPSAELLAAVYGGVAAQVAVLPTERPMPDARAIEAAEDPIAAAIRAAEAGAAPAPASGPSVSSALVMKIQKGLSNIAYADIAVDGVAGEKTRQAIRAFEKHYRLPTTGEPNALVLNKLKEIGAL